MMMCARPWTTLLPAWIRLKRQQNLLTLQVHKLYARLDASACNPEIGRQQSEELPRNACAPNMHQGLSTSEPLINSSSGAPKLNLVHPLLRADCDMHSTVSNTYRDKFIAFTPTRPKSMAQAFNLVQTCATEPSTISMKHATSAFG